jgi:hypothetical protein
MKGDRISPDNFVKVLLEVRLRIPIQDDDPQTQVSFKLITAIKQLIASEDLSSEGISPFKALRISDLKEITSQGNMREYRISYYADFLSPTDVRAANNSK